MVSGSLSMYAWLVASSKDYREYTPMSLDQSAMEHAFALSLLDWRKWAKYVALPFEKTFIEFDPRVFGINWPGTSVPTKVGVIAREHLILVSMTFKGYDTMLASPFQIYLDHPPHEPLSGHWAELPWGPEYVQEFGFPKKLKVGLTHPEAMGPLSEKEKLDMATLMVGQSRVVCAVLALINMHADIEQVPARPARSGRKYCSSAKKHVPAWEPHVITLHPFRKVHRPNKNKILSTLGRKVGQHEVRGHWRLYGERRRKIHQTA